MTIMKIDMPQVGESVTEAVIGKWLISPGDSIRKYDPIVEVITDKVNMEVPSPNHGTISALLVNEGDTVAMGTPIAEMEVTADVASPASSEPSSSDTDDTTNTVPKVQSATRIGTMITGANVGPTGGEFQDTSLDVAPTTTPTDDSQNDANQSPRTLDRRERNRKYSPVVRRLAQQHGIDLDQIKGSGRGGRISKRDVEQYLASQDKDAETKDQLIEPDPIRRIIADNMTRSFREIPHAWGAIEVDVSQLVHFRNSQLHKVQAATGKRLTYLPIILHHIAQTLRQHPRINSSWTDNKILLKHNINIGIAVAAKQGLVVPTLRNADALGLNDTVSEMARLITAARENKLTIQDVQDGTFTLNNTGALGSIWGGAIINHPQAAIITTEAIVKRPVVVHTPQDEDAIAIRPIMNLCISFDHRIIDGAEAMAFLQDIKQRLESISTQEQHL